MTYIVSSGTLKPYYTIMGARCGQKLGRVRKWLHCDALRHSAGDVQVYKMYRYINP